MRFEFTFMAGGTKWTVKILAKTPESALNFWEGYKAGLEQKHRVKVDFVEMIEI